MNTLAVAYLVVGSLNLVAVVVQGAQALLIRKDPVPRWIALSSLGFGMFNIGIIFVSRETGAQAPTPWLAWASIGLGLVLGAAFVPMTAWSLLELPSSRVRAGIAAGLGALASARMVVLLLAVNRNPMLFWEDVNTGFSTLAVPAGLVATFVAVIWFGESLRAIRHATPFGRAMAAFGVLAVLTSLVSLPVSLGLTGGVDPYGFAALPFFAFVNTLSTLRYVHALKTRDEPVGELARYQILSPLTRGGMGEIFLARRLGPAGFLRDVVLKMLPSHSPDPAARVRFLAEARLAAQLRHPNIIDVYDLGSQPDGFFIVMERLDGPTLSEVILQSHALGRPVPPEVVAELGVQLCQALGYAHGARVIHRDLKPQNVILTFSGVVKLIDFGIAQEQQAPFAERPTLPGAVAVAEDSGRLTVAHGIVGTHGYIAPERLRGGDAGVQTDLFALGVLLYEVLTGHSPFAHASSLDFIAAVEGGRLRKPAELRPEASPALCAAIESCLGFDPATRPPSAATLQAHLEDAVRGLRVDLAGFAKGLFADGKVPMQQDAPTRAVNADVQTTKTVNDRLPPT
jgi:serine/threonine-protein kinase